MSQAALHSPGNGRGMLLLIVGLLILPFVIGGGLYFSGWHPTRASTHGNLLEPSQPLPDDLLRSTAKMRGKWILFVNVRGTCESACIARLDEIRRIHVALYKNMDRLRRVVITDQPDDTALLALVQTQPDLLLAAAPSQAPTETDDPVLLADPQGQLIMTFPNGTSAQGIRADIERLLKFTWNG
ncbi:MAG: hypothetical protein WAR41_02500 [Azonexus sp.]